MARPMTARCSLCQKSQALPVGMLTHLTKVHLQSVERAVKVIQPIMARRPAPPEAEVVPYGGTSSREGESRIDRARRASFRRWAEKKATAWIG